MRHRSCFLVACHCQLAGRHGASRQVSGSLAGGYNDVNGFACVAVGLTVVALCFTLHALTALVTVPGTVVIVRQGYVPLASPQRHCHRPGVFTSPNPPTVRRAHPPQSVQLVTVLVCSLKVQSTLNDGNLKRLIVQVGSGVDFNRDAANGEKGEHTLNTV
jgi:hypothetical protein